MFIRVYPQCCHFLYCSVVKGEKDSPKFYQIPVEFEPATQTPEDFHSNTQKKIFNFFRCLVL